MLTTTGDTLAAGKALWIFIFVLFWLDFFPFLSFWFFSVLFHFSFSLSLLSFFLLIFFSLVFSFLPFLPLPSLLALFIFALSIFPRLCFSFFHFFLFSSFFLSSFSHSHLSWATTLKEKDPGKSNPLNKPTLSATIETQKLKTEIHFAQSAGTSQLTDHLMLIRALTT